MAIPLRKPRLEALLLTNVKIWVVVVVVSVEAVTRELQLGEDSDESVHEHGNEEDGGDTADCNESLSSSVLLPVPSACVAAEVPV